jgi:hypothetical protein
MGLPPNRASLDTGSEFQTDSLRSGVKGEIEEFDVKQF